MDTINEWRASPRTEQQPVNNSVPCQNGHSVDGVTAGKYDEILNGKVCDCNRIRFVWELCGCPNVNEYRLMPKPNE